MYVDANTDIDLALERTCIHYAQLSRKEWGAWGEYDCCQFVRQYLLYLTGKDYQPADISYEGRLSAYKLLDQSGGIIGIFKDILGDPTQEYEYECGGSGGGDARVGDCLLYTSPSPRD